MGNRKQPFGYYMTMGEITIQPAEAKLVRRIFQDYSTGASLGELTKALSQQNIPYCTGRTWNKNMVSRILEDGRYIGEKGYPRLIEPDQFYKTAEKKAAKVCPSQKSPAQKVLHRLCGTQHSEQMERIIMDMLNSLIRCPNHIQTPAMQTTDICGKIREELDAALEEQPIDEDKAKALLLRLAAEQYAAIGDTEYETVRLRRLFTSHELMAELDASVLQSAVSKITVTSESVTATLKNGQIIERGSQM